jgi:hypothetical protein
MNGQEGVPTAVAIAGGNILYVVLTVVLSMVFDVLPTDLFSGSFSSVPVTIVAVWGTLGALLFIYDLKVASNVIPSIGGGW